MQDDNTVLLNIQFNVIFHYPLFLNEMVVSKVVLLYKNAKHICEKITSLKNIF